MAVKTPAQVRALLKKRNPAVLMGGWSAEREVSLKTGQAMLAALRRCGISARGIDATRDVAAQLRRAKTDFAVIALHGTGGEDGCIQGLLEVMQIPYTGSGVLASALSMDKEAAKEIFTIDHLPTAPWRTLFSTHSEPRNLLRAQEIGFPLVIKPVSQGSAIGISIVRRKSELAAALRSAFRYDPRALAEKFIPGREMTVGILGEEALPVIEICPRNAFYDYEAKYAPGMSSHLVPAPLSEVTARRMQTDALAAFHALGCRGVGRVDFRLTPNEEPFLLEMNTVPGMTEQSLLPEAAAYAGISFDELVLRIIGASL